MKFYVYELRDDRGLVFYVGKGSGKRMLTHQAKATNGQRGKKAEKIRSILKLGGKIVPVIVYATDDEQEAFRVECELIALYGRSNLTNLTDGGDGSSNPSQEVRDKIAAGRLGIIASAQTREKQRQRKLGIPRELTTRNKISKFQRGSKHPWASAVALSNIASGMRGPARHSPETLAKMREVKLGHVVSVETRQKISRSKKSSIPWNKGLRAIKKQNTL